MSDVPRDGQRVVAVTGGGGGIGAAIAEELGRQGAFVVTMDPLVTLDGSEQLPAREETTAGRIVAAGGSARATTISVTDAAAVADLFADLPRLDAVINVAGISRPTSFAKGTEDDWRDVVAVHLDGYLNVLAGALPVMAAAGHGRILGVTSGSGWRPADTGAYGCAKRAVAALTWQLGGAVPEGVVVNAMSPIAVTRMVTAALARVPASGSSGGSAATGGLSLGSMPQPEELGPLGAHLVGEDLSWCSGHVVFAGGSEVAVVEPPRLLEVVRTSDARSLPDLIDAVVPVALAPAESAQASTGASNPRFDATVDAPRGARGAPAVGSCAIVSDRPAVASALVAALSARAITTHAVPVADDFAAAGAALDAAGPVDAVVVALAGAPAAAGAPWERILAEHAGIAHGIHADAAWTRAAADRARTTSRPMRVVTLTDATTAGGRSRAQAVAQHARSSRRATRDGVAAFAVSVESAQDHDLTAAAELAGHLLGAGEGPELAGAELVVGAGWLGLRGHPRAATSFALGGSAIPRWFDDALREAIGAPEGGR
ncbi:MAG: SDR family NAD(P)-dependent oxidoreductase [Acidimicrobiales bacterium]